MLEALQYAHDPKRGHAIGANKAGQLAVNRLAEAGLLEVREHSNQFTVKLKHLLTEPLQHIAVNRDALTYL